jgi:hypothetical protein
MRFIAYILFIAISLKSIGQTPTTSWEIGGQGGGAYYLGDINRTHILPSNLHLGAFLRYNYDSRFALKTSLGFGRIQGNDANSSAGFNNLRGLSFQNDIYELSSVIEFNFFDFMPFRDDSYKATPYAFLGLSYFIHNPKLQTDDGLVAVRNAQLEGESYSAHQAAIPFGAGIKIKGKGYGIGLFWGIRKTWTDYLDDISTNFPAQGDIIQLSTNDRLQRGEVHTKDWFVFTGLTFFVSLRSKRVCPN